ncbi:hypothetical protein G7Y89_g10854 [Cudoniella acicularis]|uniref:Uncharacterized protein n=1 Tax=Cudoniella acicularis TaxID=354080 RepID=A0A8H4VYD0_9HELO|nr:hypothetical protein G7Y89_g10854 [Cudoniella acicularis]
MSSTESTINELPASNKAGLTYDTIEILLSYTNIGYVDSAIELLGAHLDDDAKEKLKYTREDVRPVFDDLTDNAEELFNVIRKSKVVLSGSRSVNFIKPGSSSRASDYDFYAEDNVHCIAMFMAYMTTIGVYWSFPSNTVEDVARLQDDYYKSARFQLIRGTLNRDGRVLDVQLMWRHGYSGSQCVLKFHSTAPQCFISGFAAVSLYHNLTSNDKSVAWYLNDISLDLKERTQIDGRVDVPHGFQDDGEARPAEKYKTQMERNKVAKQKYIDRGFTYVTKTCDDKPMGKFGGIIRHIGDDKSYVIPLDKYLDVSSWQPTFDEYVDRLNYVSWIELEGRIEVVSNPLSKYVCLDTSPEWLIPERSLERNDERSLYLRALAGEHYELSFNPC